ncbi:MAG: DUF5615 family PIN-like protein [Chloroflexi bacterium]|nr:DUF5615 family PIN-like protein [Chloroflexota bacterium]
MADRISFHLDEHVGHAIARGLRQRGIEVTTTVEAQLRTHDDDAQLTYILQRKCVFVTNDAGFLARSTAGQQHFGLVYYPSSSRSIGEVVTFLTLLYEIMTPDEMINRVEYL